MDRFERRLINSRTSKRPRLCKILLLTGLLAAPGQTLASTERIPPYKPLDLKSVTFETPKTQLGYIVQELKFPSEYKGQVPATMIRPAAGRHPIVIYLINSRSDRGEFRREAERLAQRGVASLLLEAPFSRPRAWATRWEDSPQADVAIRKQYISDTRRAMDLLSSLRSIDPQAICIVGDRVGAAIGLIVAALDPRPECLVLISAFGSQLSFYRNNPTIAEETRQQMGSARFEAHLRSLKPYEQVDYAAKLRPSVRVLAQFDIKDSIPRDENQAFCDAIAGKKQCRWYDTAPYEQNNWVTRIVSGGW